MSIVEHLKKSKKLLLDAIEDIRYRMYFGEDRPQSTVSLKDKLKTPVRDLAVLLCIIAVVALCVTGVVMV